MYYYPTARVDFVAVFIHQSQLFRHQSFVYECGRHDVHHMKVLLRDSPGCPKDWLVIWYQSTTGKWCYPPVIICIITKVEQPELIDS